MAREAELIALVDAFTDARRQLHRRLADQAADVLRRWPDLYRGETVARLTATLGQLATAGQAQSASMLSAFLARVLSLLTGREVAPPGVRLDYADLRGLPAQRVYERIPAEYRRRVADDASPAEALEAAERRLRVVVDDDLMLGERHATVDTLSGRREVTGYRRVIHPERSAGGTCGLCMAAADRIYRTDELMPIHGRCKCEPMPIVGGRDPGSELNAADLAAIYREAGDTSAAALKRVRYRVERHGELGPVLREAGDEFTSADELPAAA